MSVLCTCLKVIEKVCWESLIFGCSSPGGGFYSTLERFTVLGEQVDFDVCTYILKKIWTHLLVTAAIGEVCGATVTGFVYQDEEIQRQCVYVWVWGGGEVASQKAATDLNVLLLPPALRQLLPQGLELGLPLLSGNALPLPLLPVQRQLLRGVVVLAAKGRRRY